jgi:PKD repeat protein
MLLPILSEIADKVGIICHSELAIKDINRGWLLPIGNGQAKSVTELDWKAGFSFFALNGNERLTELDSGRARSILLQSVRPLSLFVVIRPEDVGADDSFSAERITQSLKTKIGANNLPISRVRLNAGMVKSSVISVQYGTAVWNELGINGEARLNLIAARFDFEVTIAGNQECFSNWVCEDGVVPAPPPPPFCADAGYVLEDTNGDVISSGAIPSGGSANIVAPNGVVSVEDSVGNVLHTVSVESAGSAVQPLADSSVTVFNSLGAVVDSGSVLAEGSGTFNAPDAAIDVNGDSSFGSVASGGALNIGVENTNGAFIGAFDNNTNSWVIGDSAVANSDNSYQVSLPATDSLALPDQSIEVNNVVEGTIPSVGTIDINLSDGTNVITPTSVAVTGRVVDIELPGGLVMAVDFVADKLVATAGETITFTDLTNNSPTNWGWLFNGDGSSNLQNPTFSFLTAGFKDITLFAAKTGLGGFTTKSSYIQIIALLLDIYPNAAAAYSLRKLRIAYTGSAIRVRRSNDNTEQDIGFVNNVLDTAALLSFVGANNGFVTTWYDQSGNNRNATQTTQANQPQIVSSGSLITENGKVAITTMGNEYLTVPSSQATFNFLHNGTNSSAFSVNKFGTSSNPNAFYGLFGNASAASANIGVSFAYDDRSSVPRNNSLYQDIVRGMPGQQCAIQTVDNTITPNQQNIISQFFDADNATAANRAIAWINAGGAIANNTLTNAPTLSNATFNFQIMATGNNFAPMDGTCQELIIYPSQPSQTGVRNELNAYYNAY